MYETLITQFCSPLYYGTEIARDLGLSPAEFLPGWRATELARATGKLTFEETMEQLMKSHGIYTPELHRKVVEKRIAIQADCFTHLHPGIVPMLSGLKSRGIRIGLITNCFSEEAKLIRESGLFPYFDAPCLSWEEGVRKPDPAIYRTCLRRLSIAPEECLYVGDGGSQELESARALGMQAVQATWYRQAAFEHKQAALRPDFPPAQRPHGSAGLSERRMPMTPIPYTLIRSDRKSIGIQITADGVVVRAPKRLSAAEIDRFVQSKRSWIEGHLSKLPAPQPKFTQTEIEALARKALTVIPDRVRHFAPIVGVSYGRITIRSQRSRWGSCSGKGNLNFNCLLMLTPSFCLDYVVVHELCHRLEMNHSPKFWTQVERVLPDYRKSREWLKEHEKELIGRL